MHGLAISFSSSVCVVSVSDADRWSNSKSFFDIVAGHSGQETMAGMEEEDGKSECGFSKNLFEVIASDALEQTSLPQIIRRSWMKWVLLCHCRISDFLSFFSSGTSNNPRGSITSRLLVICTLISTLVENEKKREITEFYHVLRPSLIPAIAPLF